MNWCTSSQLRAALAAGAVAFTGCGGDEPVGPTSQPSFLLSPRAPSSASAVAVAYDAIRVTWMDNSTNESGFQVYRSTTGSTGTFSLRSTRLANSTSFRDGGLTPQKSYCYKVRAFRAQDGTRSYSAFSNVACATTPASPLPAAPSGTVARPVSSTAVRTTWSDKSSNEDGFRVQRSTDAGATWTTAGTVGPNITAFRDNGRSTERPVCYRVIAFNEHGNSASSNTDCTTPPAKPTDLTAAAVQGSINLTWADNSQAEDGYQVQRSTDGTTFSTIGNPEANTTSYNDAGATSTTTTYSYRVRAKKDGGFSDFSSVVSATTGGSGIAAPSGTTVMPVASDNVVVTWIDNSNNEEWFRVEYSPTSAGPWASVGTQLGSGYTSYRFRAVSEQQICYRIIAFNATSESMPSNADCTTPPAAPTGLTAKGAAAEIELKWMDNSSAEDGYEVRRRASTQNFEETVAGLPANTTSYRDVTVSSNQSYWYYVRAKKDGGYSSNSNTVSAAAATATPNAPSDPSAAPRSSTSVEVRWVDNSTDEEGFQIERSTDGGASWVLVGTVPWWGQPFSDAGLASEQQVCYRVKAYNAHGASAPSNVDCTTPPNAPIAWIAPIDQETADLVWSDNSAVEDGYEIWFLDGWTLGPQFLTSLPANSTSYRLTEGAYWYEWWVRATKDGGYSDAGRAWSDPPTLESSARTSPGR